MYPKICRIGYGSLRSLKQESISPWNRMVNMAWRDFDRPDLQRTTSSECLKAEAPDVGFEMPDFRCGDRFQDASAGLPAVKRDLAFQEGDVTSMIAVGVRKKDGIKRRFRFLKFVDARDLRKDPEFE